MNQNNKVNVNIAQDGISGLPTANKNQSSNPVERGFSGVSSSNNNNSNTGTSGSDKSESKKG